MKALITAIIAALLLIQGVAWAAPSAKVVYDEKGLSISSKAEFDVSIIKIRAVINGKNSGSLFSDPKLTEKPWKLRMQVHQVPTHKARKILFKYGVLSSIFITYEKAGRALVEFQFARDVRPTFSLIRQKSTGKGANEELTLTLSYDNRLKEEGNLQAATGEKNNKSQNEGSDKNGAEADSATTDRIVSGLSKLTPPLPPKKTEAHHKKEQLELLDPTAPGKIPLPLEVDLDNLAIDAAAKDAALKASSGTIEIRSESLAREPDRGIQRILLLSACVALFWFLVGRDVIGRVQERLERRMGNKEPKNLLFSEQPRTPEPPKSEPIDNSKSEHKKPANYK